MERRKINWNQVIAVTNRTLCEGDFLKQVEKVAALHVQAIILREKDLTLEEYRKLAIPVMEICRQYGVPCILHKFVGAAVELGCPNIHLPLADLLKLRGNLADYPANRTNAAGCEHSMSDTDGDILKNFCQIGASVHSVEDALLAERAGCTYMTAGHVFATDCKKNLPPRGIDFLQNICKTVSVPVFGIGGIHPDNMHLAIAAGASGVCMMSELMKIQGGLC